MSSQLSSLLSDLPRPMPGPKCTVGRLLAELATTDPEGRAALVAALDNPSVSPRVLSDALLKAGHAIRAQTVRRHRKRGLANGCACDE